MGQKPIKTFKVLYPLVPLVILVFIFHSFMIPASFAVGLLWIDAELSHLHSNLHPGNTMPSNFIATEVYNNGYQYMQQTET